MEKNSKAKEKKNALSALKGKYWKVFLCPTVKLLECAAELTTPFIIRYIIDDGIANNDIHLTVVLSLVVFALAVLGFCFTMIGQYFAARVSADYSYDLRKDIYGHIAELSESDLNQYGKQKLLTLLSNDVFSMQNGVMLFMRFIFRPPFIVVGATILSFVIDWKSGLIFLAVMVLSSVIIAIIMLASPKRYAAIQSNLDEISLLSNDALQGARPIRAFNKENYEIKKFSSSVESYEKKNMSMAGFNSLLNPATFLFVNAGMVLIVYLEYKFGVLNETSHVGFITIGQLVSLISYLTTSLTALISFQRLIVSMNKAAASKKRIDQFFVFEPAIINQKKFHKNDHVEDAPYVSFQNVGLTYGKEGEKMAVENLTFDIKEGSWIGLIGGTGSGKSTTISLLERLYEPSAGKIYYRGRPLDEYDLDDLRKEISLVSQKPSIFKGTIRSNLLIAKKDATEEELIEALKKSLAFEYVSKYDDFIDHEVEEMGANLSGGQKQRLLIARAILKGGDLLILDDSTSALDYLSDQQVRHNISAIPGLTKIIISQRAGSLKDCDLILVFDKGKIIAQGKHEELLKTCSVYQEIYEMQKKGA